MKITLKEALTKVALAYGLDEGCLIDNPIYEMLKDESKVKCYDNASEVLTKKNVIIDGENFVFDFKSGVVFADLFTLHSVVMQAIYFEVNINSLPDMSKIEKISLRRDHADSYIEEGYGAFRSGAGRYIIIGENTALPKELSSPFFKGMIKRL